MVGTISCPAGSNTSGAYSPSGPNRICSRATVASSQRSNVEPASGALLGARVVAQHAPGRVQREAIARQRLGEHQLVRAILGERRPAAAARRRRRPRSRRSRETGRRRRTNAGRTRSWPAADAPAPPRRARRLQAAAGGSARIRPGRQPRDGGAEAIEERRVSRSRAPATGQCPMPARGLRSICRPARTAPCFPRPPSPRRAAPTRRGPAAGRSAASRFEPSL